MARPEWRGFAYLPASLLVLVRKVLLDSACAGTQDVEAETRNRDDQERTSRCRSAAERGSVRTVANALTYLCPALVLVLVVVVDYLVGIKTLSRTKDNDENSHRTYDPEH